MTGTIDAETGRALEALIHEHAWLIDQGEAQRLPDLFAEDARLLGLGPDKVGRPAIAEWAGQRAAMHDRRSRHVQTNIRLEAVSSTSVRGTVIVLVFRHDGPGAGSPVPLLVGEYADLYAKGPDHAWRFAERRLTIVFGTP